jgi:peptidoglycan/xylan/chitin deacetylase (PgdA/CDA1 family)
MSKLIVTTSWDDGQKADLVQAKLLNKYGLKGTFYINKSYEKFLEKKEIIEIAKMHEIGAHTLSHADLVNIGISEAANEICGSKDFIEDILGYDISMFSYPYGRYNEDIKKIIKRAGFKAARTTEPGDFSSPSDPYEWHITADASNGSPRLILKIKRMFPISLKSLFDWELRAKSLFDLALVEGGIYHIWGHSAGYDQKREWLKLERLFDYISFRKDVSYLTNGEALSEFGSSQ